MTEEREMKSDGTLAGTYYSHSFYDELNRLIATVNNMGNTRYFYYDSRGNLRIFRDANGADAGSLSESDLDPYGEHEYEFSLHDPDINLPGHRTEYGYDALGRRTWTRQYYDPVDPDNYYETMLVWDENSRLEKQVDDNGNETQYFYDNKDRRWRIRYASSTEINPVETIIIYHSSDVVYQIIDPNLGTITHEFDSLGRVINREARPGPGSTVGRYDEYGTTFEFFEYDALGRVIFAEDNDTQTEMTYDSLGNLYSETQTIAKWRGGNWEDLEDPVTEEVHSGYDGSGNRLWGPTPVM
jgi:YD repeat-containing protein